MLIWGKWIGYRPGDREWFAGRDDLIQWRGDGVPAGVVADGVLGTGVRSAGKTGVGHSQTGRDKETHGMVGFRFVVDE